MSRILMWFRRDLRVQDNEALHQAVTNGNEVLPVFVVDARHKEWKHGCGDRTAFKLACLKELRRRIKQLGGELIVRVGDHAEQLGEIAGRFDVDEIYWNRSYEPYELERDRAVRNRMDKNGVEVSTFKDQVMFEKKEILTGKGEPYKVFSYYAKKWKKRDKPPIRSVPDAISSPPVADPGEIPTVEELGLERRSDWLVQPGEAAARENWQQFADKQLCSYHDNRDKPALAGTSKLSPYLRFGVVSVREIHRDCSEKLKENAEFEGIETFLEELIWRDFYHQVIYNFPHAAAGNFNQDYDAVRWNDDEEWFEAWKSGRTGYPLVDAALRQLNQTGWMHNRLRMIAAMFLTKNCLIDWRRGERYFMNHLYDGDTAANNGGWQWSASTGTDAAPYFRIFNPVTQSERFDPQGEFIRRFCPELTNLPNKQIHAPWQATPEILEEAEIKLGEDYPRPILDHSKRRELAIEEFKHAKNKSN